MSRLLKLIVCLLALLWPGLAIAQPAPDTEKRIAIVIGNAAYQSGALNTPANDAGLIAQTLEAAGFDVVGARDLDQDTLRRAFRDFIDKAQASGPNTVVFIYLGGYGLQLEGENYFVPVDARIARDADIVAQAIRISDYTRPLAALGLRTSIVVLDAARPHPFASSGAQLAGGLALVEPEPGMLVAFNAAPDTVAPEGPGPYGPYAQALAEMMREGGMPLAEVFERVRLRVNEITGGAEVPWHVSRVQAPYMFFERGPDAPPPPVSFEEKTAYRARPIRDLGAEEAYVAALERDTLEGYLDFLAAYPDDPMARRVRAIVAARREAITWRRTRFVDTPEAYWSYLRRYPRGRHAYEARRRLAFLTAVLEPPPTFRVIDYDVPPPPPEEFVYIERRVLVFDDPVFAFAPPPPPPIFFLARRSPEFVILLAPPPPPIAIFVLPIPVYRPVPIWVRAPAYVSPPPANNVIFNNIHNTVVINNTTNVITVTNRSGQTTTMAPPSAPPSATGGPVRPAGVGPALPPSVAQKADQPPQGAPPAPPGQPQTQQPQQPGQAQPGQPLPGMKGVPLPLIPPAGPAQPAQPATKQPVQQPQPGQALPKGPTVPPKGPQPTGVPPPGQPATKQPGQPQPGQALPKSSTLPPAKGPAPIEIPPSGQPPTKQTGQQPRPGQPLPKDQTMPPSKGAQSPQDLRQRQLEQQKQRQLDLQKQQQDQQRQRQIDQQRQKQLEQQKQQQDQQRQRQLEQQRQQQLQEQQRQRQIEQQRQQPEQQRQRQLEQQRQQDQQRQRQLEQQRQQDQQRQRQIEQQRQQQLEQQRQRQIEQQKPQQRQQQIPQQRQQPQPPPQKKPQNCGGPGQPACPK